jgi:hypothetical protein
LQAAVDAALAAFPQDAARIAKAAALVARDYVVPPTATQPAWLVGPAQWQVTRISPGQYECQCPDYAFRRQPCKHVMATWLSRKVQQMPAPRSLAYYGDWQGVAGVVTIYESGDIQATFQPHTGMFPVIIPLERWHEVVLGGRKDQVDVTYPRD